MSVNIISQYVNFSKKCIKNYMKLIMKSKYDEDAFNELMKIYIDIRYYDLYPRQKNTFISNITYYLSQKVNEIVEEDQYKDNTNVKNMFLLFGYILVFDNAINCDSAKDVIRKLNEFRIEKLNINEEDFEKNIFEIVKADLLRKKEYLNNFNNKSFEIIYNTTNIRNLYNVDIEQKLKFPKIYSKYAIDKVFVSKEINEHKLFIIYPIVAAKILTNIIDGQFKKTYLIDYNLNLNNKEKKLKRLYSLIDDDIAKEKIIMKINFIDFLKNKKFFMDNMKLGYNYAAIINANTTITCDNVNELKFFKYILISQNHANFADLCKLNNVVIVR